MADSDNLAQIAKDLHVIRNLLSKYVGRWQKTPTIVGITPEQ